MFCIVVAFCRAVFRRFCEGDFHLAVCQKGTGAFQHRHAVGFKKLLYAGHQLVDGFLFVVQDFTVVDGHFFRMDAEPAALQDFAIQVGRMEHRLGWDAAAV